mmetsp:Transcript_9850/g.11812  ORF Transcript_9850/g.11812 Transcript_9850/m.11812 type:complete len:312 (-) Transcript_9850:25-960(-)
MLKMDEVELGQPQVPEGKMLSDDVGKEKKGFGSLKIWVGCILLVGVIAGVAAYFATRPEDLERTTSEQTTSPLSVASLIETEGEVSGTIVIQQSFLLAEPSNVSYFLNLENVIFPEATNITLEFSKNSSLDNETIVIKQVQSLEFPYKLPSMFNPFEYVIATFKDEDDNVLGNSTSNSTASEEEVSLVLTAQLGGSYSIGGSITMMNVKTLSGEDLIEETVLVFKGITISGAPGPFLYLSKDRTFSSSSDLEVPIDGGATRNGKPGFYTKLGDFTQVISPALDLTEYENGRWIVWCLPFTVVLGGGNLQSM